ncbi:MAG: M23 family metallopeptidase [Caulobacteraceae bacterium]|nr:M23 family metallopeptidase [Caulobacteraceae bacterium]
MVLTTIGRWRRAAEAFFPERHLYIRSAGQVRGVVLTTGRQIALATGVSGLALWSGLCSLALLANALTASPAEEQVLKTKAHYERLIADRDARLNSAVAQLNENGGAVEALAQSTEKRHEALALLLTEARTDPAMVRGLAPAPIKAFAGGPLAGMNAVRADQDRLIAQAETYAKSRAERLRLAYRLAGLDPAAIARGSDQALGGPLIEAKDPRALAAVLDVDEAFAARVQHAANDISDTRALSSAAKTLPLNEPTDTTAKAGSYGVRLDPFTGHPAFHPGLDFPGPVMSPILATAPGVVAFTGVRSGYGSTIEIDHGHGFKTRYAHLAAISVHVGDQVALGQRIGALGSTGRSTGPHLHYEIWMDGRVQNPQRFLEAGANVHQAQ